MGKPKNIYFCILTGALINGKNIPDMNRPSKGPPTIPNILNIIWNNNSVKKEKEKKVQNGNPKNIRRFRGSPVKQFAQGTVLWRRYLWPNLQQQILKCPNQDSWENNTLTFYMITYTNYLELFNLWSVKKYVIDCFYMTAFTFYESQKLPYKVHIVTVKYAPSSKLEV